MVNKTAAATGTTTTNNNDTKPDSEFSPDPIPDKSATVDVSGESEVSSGGTVTPAAPNADPHTTSVVSDRYAHQRKQRGYNYGDDAADGAKKEEEKGKVVIPHDDPNSIYVGLRVYTHNDVPAVVVGKLKADSEKEVQPAASTEIKAG